MPPTATLDPTSQSTQLSYNPQGQLSAVTLPAKVGTRGIPVINAGTAGTLAPGQRKVTLGYNAAGDVNLITDALGQRVIGGNRGQIKITTIQNGASDHAVCGRR